MWSEDVRGENGGATYSGYTVFAGETIYAPQDYWDVGYKVVTRKLASFAACACSLPVSARLAPRRGLIARVPDFLQSGVIGLLAPQRGLIAHVPGVLQPGVSKRLAPNRGLFTRVPGVLQSGVSGRLSPPLDRSRF